jgi:hypothetical protein
MTAPLELRYRRLLAVYPAAHRQAYEEEMVGVLMAGAGPDQRHPALGEAVNLLWSGLVARLGRGRQGMRGAAWRDAAAVAALISVVLLTAVAGRRLFLGVVYFREYGDPMRHFGLDGGLLIDVAARSVAWLAVLVALALAARRTAVALAVVALLVEIAAIVVWLPGQEFRVIRMSWAPALGLLTIGLLLLSRRGRPVTAILGRRGLSLIAAALVLTAGGAAPLQGWRMSAQILGLITVTDAMLLVAGGLLLAGFRPIPAPARRRTLALLAPVGTILYAQRVLEQAIGINSARVVTPGMVLADVLIMVGLPALAFGPAAAAVHARENLRVSVVVREPGEEIGREAGRGRVSGIGPPVM